MKLAIERATLLKAAEIPRGEWDERHVRDAMLDRALVPTLGPDERAIDALGELAA